MGMRSPSASIALLLVGVMLVVLGSAPRTSAQAPVPSHDVGDAVGFGVQLDLGPLAVPFLEQIRQMVSMYPNTTIDDLNFTGSLDAWHAEEVIEETASQYTIRQENAFGVQAHFRLSVTSANLPAAGTHTGTINQTFGFCESFDIPVETRTVTATLDVTYLQTSEGAANWSVAEFGVLNSYSNNAIDLRANFAARNIPEIDVNFTACEETVTYRDLNYGITADVNSGIRTSYSPALDLFDFPIVDGSNWSVNSTQTSGGTLRGVIDVQGIDPEDERAFFDILNASLSGSPYAVTGLDGFPIVLERITIFLGLVPYLEDGVLHDTSSDLSARLEARERTMTLADGQFHTVYEISMVTSPEADPYFACFYSPDDGFVVGCAVIDRTTGIFLFELENVPPAQARANIEATKAAYVVSAPGNVLADFFFKAPYLGLFVIVAAVVVIAALLSRRRRKPTAMPPTAGPVPPRVLPPSPPAGTQEPEEL